MNIQDFAKNFAKNRDLKKDSKKPTKPQPQPHTPDKPTTPDKIERKLADTFNKAILVKTDEHCWVFYFDPQLSSYRGHIGTYDVEGACAFESGVYLCKADLHHEDRETGRADVFVLNGITTPEIKTHTTPWGQTFAWFDLPEIAKEIDGGRSARVYADKNRSAIVAYTLWQQWNLGEYDNRENAWEEYYNSQECQKELLELLVAGVLEHQIDMIKFKMFPTITVFRNSNVDVEITFDKTHPAARYMPRRKLKNGLETQSKMPESIVPTHSRYSQRGTHSEMSFFDGRWVRDSEAGWCDPDWTSGD